ncbi:MAG TPA: MFS transporter [Acidimicrobiales bacterium]|nr:MFS transporter [Acidimicrobiales bacterium]
MAGRGGRLVGETFSSLRIRNFRLFFVGQLVSNSGNWLTIVALTLLVLHRTDRGTAVGLLSACQFGPMLVLSAWAGLVADRVDKRRLLCLTQGLEMGQSATLAALAFIPGIPLVVFYLVALAGGVMLAFDNPARRSFVNEMVDRPNVTNAVTLYSALVNLSRIFGPTVAGLLVVSLGFGWCFTIDAVSYVGVLTALVMMRPGELYRGAPSRRGPGQIRAGLRYIRRAAELRISFVVLLVIGAVSYNFTVVFPLFVEKGLHRGDAAYAFLYAVFSAGSVIGSLFVARRSEVGMRSIVGGAALFGVAMIGLALSPGMTVAYPVAALVGGASVAYMTATTALAQLRAEPVMVGRVLGLQTVLLIGTTPVSGPLLGLLADLAGARMPVLVGGVAAAGASVYAAVAWFGPARAEDRALAERAAAERGRAVT